MANTQASVLVNKVKPHKDSWKVHVKLLYSWTQNTSYGGETLECGLADQTILSQQGYGLYFQKLARLKSFSVFRHIAIYCRTTSFL
ncbi:unnamed protein product [Brassica napus]|uniref:(rape) hypothetical protein n=1 Tax=Brassica napus TaxID=3708 RepID=A0A816RDW6_BRANA|nr:unnamed protein product [Brassica napus]